MSVRTKVPGVYLFRHNRLFLITNRFKEQDSNLHISINIQNFYPIK